MRGSAASPATTSSSGLDFTFTCFLRYLLRWEKIQVLDLLKVYQVSPSLFLNTNLKSAFPALKKLGIYERIQFDEGGWIEDTVDHPLDNDDRFISAAKGKQPMAQGGTAITFKPPHNLTWVWLSTSFSSQSSLRRAAQWGARVRGKDDAEDYEIDGRHWLGRVHRGWKTLQRAHMLKRWFSW